MKRCLILVLMIASQSSLASEPKKKLTKQEIAKIFAKSNRERELIMIEGELAKAALGRTDGGKSQITALECTAT